MLLLLCSCCVAPAVLLLLQMGFVFKKDLQKKKNDDEVEEGWVACDCCDNWVHMICGLFNKGRNDQNVHYLCPYCLQQVRPRPVQSLRRTHAVCWAHLALLAGLGFTGCLWEAVASCVGKHGRGMSADSSTQFAAAALRTLPRVVYCVLRLCRACRWARVSASRCARRPCLKQRTCPPTT